MNICPLTRPGKTACRILALVCILLLNVNSIALAHFDWPSSAGTVLEIQDSHHDEDSSPSGHDSHQCNLSKNLNLRDTGEQILLPAREVKLISSDPDIIFGQLSSPPLRPPKY